MEIRLRYRLGERMVRIKYLPLLLLVFVFGCRESSSPGTGHPRPAESSLPGAAKVDSSSTTESAKMFLYETWRQSVYNPSQFDDYVQENKHRFDMDFFAKATSILQVLTDKVKMNLAEKSQLIQICTNAGRPYYECAMEHQQIEFLAEDHLSNHLMDISQYLSKGDAWSNYPTSRFKIANLSEDSWKSACEWMEISIMTPIKSLDMSNPMNQALKAQFEQIVVDGCNYYRKEWPGILKTSDSLYAQKAKYYLALKD